MNSFLSDVAQSLVLKFSTQLSDIEIVVPSRRAAIYLKKHLSQLNVTSIPKLYSVNDWFLHKAQKIFEVKPANKYVLLFSLFETYQTLVDAKHSIVSQDASFEDFIKIGEQILSDFDMIDRYLINPDKLFESIADFAELSQFLVEDCNVNEIINQLNSRDLVGRFIINWGNFIKIYTEFNKALSDSKLSYQGRIYRDLANYLESSEDNSLEVNKSILQTTVFVGLNALSESEKVILRSKSKLSDTYFIWDYDQKWLTDGFCEATHFIAKNMQEFPQASFFNNSSSKNNSPQITSISTTSSIMQCKVASRILKDFAKNDGTTAIILTDESIALPLLRSITQDSYGLNISIGYPLSYTLMGQLVRMLLRLINSTQYSINKETTIFKTALLTPILNHKMVVDLYPEIKNISIQGSTISLIELQNQAPEFSKILPSGYVGASDLCNFIDSVLIRLQSNIVSKEDKYITDKLQEVISNERDSLEFLSKKALSISFIIDTIEKLLSSSRIDFQGISGSRIEIIGILESRTLDFDNIIMLGIEEGSFPNPSSDNSFIPLSLYTHFKLPTIAEKSAIWSYYFYRLLIRSSKVSLLYSNVATSKSIGEPSRYIQQLRHSVNYNISDTSVLIDSSRYSKNFKFNTAKTIQHIASLKGITLSPSSIALYLNCPYAFYLKYIEKIRPADIVEDQLTPRESGIIMHNTLYNLYSPLVNKPYIRELVTKITRQEIIENLNKVIDIVVTNPKFRRSQMLNLMTEDILSSIINIVDYDKGPHSEKLSQFTNMESRFYCEIKGIKISGIIDRIDMLSDGTQRIIDYKSSAPNLKLDDLSSPFTRHYLQEKPNAQSAALQLLIYSYMLDREHSVYNIMPLIFNPRNKNELALHLTINSQSKNVLDSDDLEIVEKELISIIDEIMNLDVNFMQCKSTASCIYCDFAPVCAR